LILATAWRHFIELSTVFEIVTDILRTFALLAGLSGSGFLLTFGFWLLIVYETFSLEEVFLAAFLAFIQLVR
jgi:hypothetical protein